MLLKTSPVGIQEAFPTLHLPILVLALEGGLDRGSVDQSIRLGKLRQAANGVAAVDTKKATDPNAQDLSDHRGNEPIVISQGFEAMRMTTMRTAFRRTNPSVILLLDVLFGSQAKRLDNLHSPP